MKKKMIAILTAALALVFALTALVACGEPTVEPEQPGNQIEQTGNETETGNQTETGGEEQGGEEEPAITSEVGLTYEHTKTTMQWASDEAKAAKLAEMEIDEATFFGIYDQATLEVKFLEENKAIIIYLLGGRGGTDNIFYKIEDGIVTFYDTQEDLNAGKAKTDNGIYAGKYKLSDDYKTLQWIAEMPGSCTITFVCTIKK